MIYLGDGNVKRVLSKVLDSEIPPFELSTEEKQKRRKQKWHCKYHLGRLSEREESQPTMNVIVLEGKCM